jgi:protein-arginine kinase
MMLLTKYLTPELEDTLKDRVTPHGVTHDLITRSGRENPDAQVGVYAGDSESYLPEYFGPLFDRIIEDYHKFPSDGRHISDLDPSHLKNVDGLKDFGDMILSTRIRVARNLDGFAFTPAITKADRLEVEKRMTNAFKSFTGDLAGTYYPLASMDEATKKRLLEEHLLFRDDDDHVRSAGMYRDWPEGRGVFLSNDRKLGIWVSEEDQRIFSLEQGSDLKSVFDRLSRALNILESKAPFAKSDRYGYLTSCPTNVGTGMRASVLIKLPNISKDEKAFKEHCTSMGLQARGMHGEHSKSGAGGIYDISNRQRLGKSEVQLVQGLYDGVTSLIHQENEVSYA